MGRNDYRRNSGGSPLRWIVGLFIAAGLTVMIVALGKLGAETACHGACSQLSELGALMAEPFPVMGETLSWGLGVAIILGVILWAALGSGSNGLALIVMLAMALVGASMAGQSKEASEEVVETIDEIIEPDPAPLSEPEPEPVMEEELIEEALVDPECPEGNFWGGDGCYTCRVETQALAEAALDFRPKPGTASWGYATDTLIRHTNARVSAPVSAFLGESVNALSAASICENDAVLVIGSASSDGPLERNLARARSRAERLAGQVTATCGTDIQIMALSLGQSVAPEDSPVDRMLTVIGLTAPEGEGVTPELVENELGYLLAGQETGVPLLDRVEYFPREHWSWVQGGEGQVAVTPSARPFQTIEEMRPGAPVSCL